MSQWQDDTPGADDRSAPITEHLEELRRRIIHSVIALVIGVGAGWSVSGTLYRYFVASAPAKLVQLGFTEVFWIHFSLGAWAGLVLAFPFILYQAVRFVLPALDPRERRHLYGLVPAAILLFVAGASFAYFLVLPLITTFFIGFTEASGTGYIITPRQYIDLIKGLLLPFGAVFELPLVVWVLAILGIVSSRLLARMRKVAILVIFVAAAVLSPGPDVVTQLMMAVPMLGLYEASIWLARLAERRRR